MTFIQWVLVLLPAVLAIAYTIYEGIRVRKNLPPDYYKD